MQYRFLWLDEPWGVSGFLEKGIRNWSMKEFRKYPDWFELHRQVYLGLITEAEMKDKEMQICSFPNHEPCTNENY